jgi:DNA polymerase (family 10)
MDSRTAAHVLSEIADLLALRAENHENRFKSRAYRTAAKAVLALDADDLDPMYRSGELAGVKGVGRATLAVIGDLIENGESTYLEQLRQHVPEGVPDLMRVPGLTVAKIQQLHETLGVSSVDELEAAARDGRLAKVKGFGEKTAERLLDAIEFSRRTSALALFPRAATEAARLVASVRRHPDVTAAEIAGSVRRHNEVVRNVDIVAAVDGEPRGIAASFTRVPGIVESSLSDGSAHIRYIDGTVLDLHCVAAGDFAVALWRATGSATHVAQMTDALAAHGYVVHGDAVRDARGERVPIPDERALYALIGLAFVPPEMREGMGEVAAASHGLPRLVTADDVRGVLHCHSSYSDGGATIAEMAQAAKERGWSYLGISDHSQSAFYAGGLRPHDVARQHDEIDALNATLTDLTVLKGIEADILPSGQLDYDDDTLDRFDYVIGSVHSRFRMTESEMTARILSALDDPRLTILGHPTGRLLLAREPYPVDMGAVLEKAAETGVALELNADPHRLDLDWRHCKRAKELGVPIEIGPDAHSTRGLDCVDVGVGIARKGWLEAHDILNARSAADVLAFAAGRRERAYGWSSAHRREHHASTDPDSDIPF